MSYPQRTNKKVSQGDSYNPEMKRRKQSICRPMCFLLAVVYLKDKICFRHFYSTISIVPQSFNVMYIYNTYITWTSIRHTHISLSFFVSLSLSLSGPFDFSHSSPFQLKYMLKKKKMELSGCWSPCSCSSLSRSLMCRYAAMVWGH